MPSFNRTPSFGGGGSMGMQRPEFSRGQGFGGRGEGFGGAGDRLQNRGVDGQFGVGRRPEIGGGNRFGEGGGLGGSEIGGVGNRAGNVNINNIQGNRNFNNIQGNRALTGRYGDHPWVANNRYLGYHQGWINGYWHGYNNGWGWGGYGLGLATGLTAWGLGSALYGGGWGYSSYSNPYYVAGPATIAQPAYDYSQPIDTASSPPADSVADPAIASFDQARAAFKTGDFFKALTLTDQALKTMPNDSALHEFRALRCSRSNAMTRPRPRSMPCCRSVPAGIGRLSSASTQTATRMSPSCEIWRGTAPRTATRPLRALFSRITT